MPLLICVTSSRSGHVQALADAACQAYGEGGGHAETMPAATGDLDRFADADAVVLATPTHLGGPAADFVAFAERSARLRSTDVLHSRWAAGITCGVAPDGGKSMTLTYLLTVALQHGMIWVGLPHGPAASTYRGDNTVANAEGARLGVAATLRGDELPAASLATAAALGARLARLGSSPRRRSGQTLVGAP
ncbi:MAG TPA: NAD(P)H-dependent oxidoreductase [Pseudonocardiaceae bacterium]|jgi:NAD(P)H dehydrogenase (quinone)